MKEVCLDRQANCLLAGDFGVDGQGDFLAYPVFRSPADMPLMVAAST